MTGLSIHSNKFFLRYANIPMELSKFVNRDTYSLLIRGNPGTGKTTLSLTLLRLLKHCSNFFYISTRTSPKQLFSYYPWLNYEISKNHGEGGNRIHSSNFEDARLDEPESLFERITNQLMDVKSPIIIIDSWDAIASFMDNEARLNNERVLQTWRERAGAKLIFIAEDTTNTKLDFLVDGIVKLEEQFLGTLRLRVISLDKLRGIKILRKSYFFTLNNGIFQTFEPYKQLPEFWFVKNDNHKTYLKNRFDSHAQTMYTGYNELDGLLGKIQKKTCMVISYDSYVGYDSIVSFFHNLFSRLISNNSTIIVHTLNEYYDSLSIHLQKELMQKKIIFFPKDLSVDSPYNQKNIDDRYRGFRNASPYSHVISVFFLFNHDPDNITINFIKQISHNSDYTIMICHESPQVNNLFIKFENFIMLRMSYYSGHTWINGIRPETPLLGLRYLKHNHLDLQPVY